MLFGHLNTLSHEGMFLYSVHLKTMVYLSFLLIRIHILSEVSIVNIFLPVCFFFNVIWCILMDRILNFKEVNLSVFYFVLNAYWILFMKSAFPRFCPWIILLVPDNGPPDLTI